MLRARILVILSLLAGFSGFASRPANAAPIKKVLLIGMDGTRIDALRVAKAPNLHQLIADGVLAEARVLGPRYCKNDTISGPGWSSILTGVWADKHGVQDNNVARNTLSKYPHFFQHLKEVQPKAFTVSVTDWQPIAQFMVRGADISKDFGAPDPKDYAPLDEKVAFEAARLLGETDPTAMFVYFGNIDHAGHTYGFHPSVAAYRGEIEHVDKLVGQVLKAVRNRKTFAQEDWLVLVTTDHGGKGKGHSNGQNSPEILTGFLIVSGPSAAHDPFEHPAYIVDVVPTVLAHLGIPIKKEWGLDGHAVGLKNTVAAGITP